MVLGGMRGHELAVRACVYACPPVPMVLRGCTAACMSWLCMHVCAGPCLAVELPDSAPEEVGEFFGRMLQDVVRQEYWAHSAILLNAPGRQQALRQLLQAAGYWHYMCDPVPGDNRALLLPCAAPVRGLGHYWVPFRPQLSGTPCLTRECNVKLVSGFGGFMQVHFTPPLVYNHGATQQPDTPEWQRDVLQLAAPGRGRDCTLQLRESERYWPFIPGLHAAARALPARARGGGGPGLGAGACG
jgi:hypothetical protein